MVVGNRLFYSCICSVLYDLHSSSSCSPYFDTISPFRDSVDLEFASTRLEDLEVVTTLGMGGFGRVELVRTTDSEGGFSSGA